MPHIIAIANEKGGVAKTTTVVSLAGALLQAGHEVLVIDLDTQANLTLALGLTPSKVRRSISDVLLNSVSLLSVSRETSVPGIDLVPSNADMGLAERFLPVRQNYETILYNTLHNNPGLSAYQFILIDCPPARGAGAPGAGSGGAGVIAAAPPDGNTDQQPIVTSEATTVARAAVCRRRRSSAMPSTMNATNSCTRVSL